MNRRTFVERLFGIACLSRGMAYGQAHDHASMSTTSTTSTTDGEFNPYVIPDTRGGFYLTYVERKSGRSDIVVQRSIENGRFSKGIRVNDTPGDGAVRNENPPKLAVNSFGDLYVVWANERERWKGNIRFARSLNGGKSFERAINLNSDASQPPVSRAFQSIVVDPQGRIFVAWIDERNKTSTDRGAEIWIAVSEDRGKTFSRDRRVISNVCECCRIALATDKFGNLYLSYRAVLASGPMFRDIAVARSSDAGRTFQSSIVHQDGWELSGCPIAGASMIVGDGGNIHVVWFTQSGETPRLFIASSSNRGLSFNAPILFDPAQKLAKHAHAVALPDSRVLIAWDDVDKTSVVKWGVFDPVTKKMRLMNTQDRASYPIIASTGNEISVVALQPDRPTVLRRIQLASGN